MTTHNLTTMIAHWVTVQTENGPRLEMRWTPAPARDEIALAA